MGIKEKIESWKVANKAEHVPNANRQVIYELDECWCLANFYLSNMRLENAYYQVSIALQILTEIMETKENRMASLEAKIDLALFEKYSNKPKI